MWRMLNDVCFAWNSMQVWRRSWDIWRRFIAFLLRRKIIVLIRRRCWSIFRRKFKLEICVLIVIIRGPRISRLGSRLGNICLVKIILLWTPKQDSKSIKVIMTFLNFLRKNSRNRNSSVHLLASTSKKSKYLPTIKKQQLIIWRRMENPNNPNNQMMMNNGAIKKMEDNGKMILIRKKIRTAM